MTKHLRINADRMLASFNQLALIGATADGGVNRPAFSEAHLAARKWFREEIESLRLGVSYGWGRQSFRFPSRCANLPTLSNFDSGFSPRLRPQRRTFRRRPGCDRRA